MLTEEFLARVNTQIERERLKPVDPRARATVNEKTLKFYVLKGLLTPPLRRGTRLDFDESHVEAVLDIKRQQAEGFTLQEIADRHPLSARVVDTGHSMGFNVGVFNAVARPGGVRGAMGLGRGGRVPEATLRWHLDLGDGYEISGSGSTPSEELFVALRGVLTNARRAKTDDAR